MSSLHGSHAVREHSLIMGCVGGATIFGSHLNMFGGLSTFIHQLHAPMGRGVKNVWRV